MMTSRQISSYFVIPAKPGTLGAARARTATLDLRFRGATTTFLDHQVHFGSFIHSSPSGLFKDARRRLSRPRASRPPALGRTAFARFLLLSSGLGKDHLADQVFETGGRLGVFDLAARRDVLLGAARGQGHVFVAEQARRDDFGNRVLRQLVFRV